VEGLVDAVVLVEVVEAGDEIEPPSRSAPLGEISCSSWLWALLSKLASRLSRSRVVNTTSPSLCWLFQSR
jgi:hypothetical protein